MQIAFHIGANCTEGERLARSLRRNCAPLQSRGICMPNPWNYRRLLRETMDGLAGRRPAPGTRDVLLDAILEDAAATRLVLTNNNFIGTPARVFEDGILYGNAPYKVQVMRELFAGDDLELHIALRNPATFIPALHAETAGGDLAAFMGGMEPADMLWSDLIARLQEGAPGVPITVWCNEDAPIIWGAIIRALAGLGPEEPVEGALDLFDAVISKDGLRHFGTYLGNHPPQDQARLRRVMTAFLEKYALATETEEEVNLAGWSEAVIEELTDIYDEDVEAIGRMDGVRLILP